MSSKHREQPSDKPWLEKRWEQDQRQQGTEPPELLDQAILNAARRALPEPRKPFHLRWVGGFATAAVAVLAIGLVLYQQPPEDLQQTQPAELRKDDSAAKMRERRLASPAPQGNIEADQPRAARSFESLSAEVADADHAFSDEPEMEGEDPNDWLQELLTLKQQGEQAKLQQELKAFMQRYPDFELPPELVTELRPE